MADKNSKMKPSVQPSVILCIITISIMKIPCHANVVLKCARPDPPALLEALGGVFNLNAIRPVRNITTPTNVTTYFVLYSVLGVDEKAQLLTTYIWLYFSWNNEFFSWDPVQCGTDRITLPRNKFWIPDVVINEFMEENRAPPAPYVRAYHNGTIEDLLPMRVVSSCRLNIYTFPFDVQNCTLTFNSFVYLEREVRMELGKPMEDILQMSREVMTTLGEWELMDITHNKYILHVSVGDVAELAFHIRLRRRPTPYVANLIIPSCFLITVDLCSFLLPPQSIDRSSFKMTLILGYTVFLLMMNDLLPTTGNDIPLINVFFCLCLALMVASLLETILITNLLCDPSWNLTPAPCWVRVVVLHTLGSLVGLHPKHKAKNNSEVKACPLVAVEEDKADGRAPEAQGPPEVEHKALEELRRLGKDLQAIPLPVEELRRLCKDLQAIRLLVEQQLTTGEQSSEEEEEWLQAGFIVDRLLFISYIIFLSVSFVAIIGIWASSYTADISR